MEKVLETIDNAIEILNQTRSMFFADHTVYGGFKKSDFNKAINGLTIISAKIEEAMKPKTCATCINRYFERDGLLLIDHYCHLNEFPISEFFGCIRYEPKDNA